MLRLLDTFSGIGGFSYAAEQIVGGYKTVAFVEREPFCQKILRKHWPDVPIHNDITTFNPEHGSADVVCGGFPCQDISAAGKQAGIKEGTRSGLFYELMRVVRLVGPQYVVLENVAAITSNGLDIVLGTLAEAGFDAEWACIPAADVGACHRRDRWWLVAYPNNARPQAPRTEQFAAGTEQHRELDVTYAVRKLRHEHRTQQAANRTTTEPWQRTELRRSDCMDVANTNHSGPQGQRSQHELSESSGEKQATWRSGGAVLNPEWRGYISKPVLRRGDDGLSNRVDRLKALGNAVVPQVAAIPLARVLEMANAQRAADPAADPPELQPRLGAVASQ